MQTQTVETVVNMSIEQLSVKYGPALKPDSNRAFLKKGSKPTPVPRKSVRAVSIKSLKVEPIIEEPIIEKPIIIEKVKRVERVPVLKSRSPPPPLKKPVVKKPERIEPIKERKPRPKKRGLSLPKIKTKSLSVQKRPPSDAVIPMTAVNFRNAPVDQTIY